MAFLSACSVDIHLPASLRRYEAVMKRLFLNLLILSCAGFAGLAPAAAAPDATSCRQQEAEDARAGIRRPLVRPLTESTLLRKKDRCRTRRILM